jgi:Na+/proline symporter
MSVLGFVAAGNPAAAPAVHAGALSPQQVGPEVIRTLLPPWGAVIFMVMILSGLSSTGDSALCAGSSLVAVDIFGRYIRPDAPPETLLRMTRFAIAGMSVLAVTIAMIPGITILSLFLFYGTLRSSTLMPTLLILFNARVTAVGVFRGVVLAILFGLPVYLTGQWTGNIHLKVGANIGIILISLAVPLWTARREQKPLAGRHGATLH